MTLVIRNIVRTNCSKMRRKECAYFGCRNRPDVDPNISFYPFPKDARMMEMWMLRMNLEYVKPLSACVCADHFHGDDIFVSEDGRELLKDSAMPIVYEFNMDKSIANVPSLRLRLLRLNDRPLSSDPAKLECTFCNTAVASNFLDLRKTDKQTLLARQIIWQHFGIDETDIEHNVSCICQICWTITKNFHTLHNTIKNVTPNHNDEQSNVMVVEYLDDDFDQRNENSSDVTDSDAILPSTDTDTVIEKTHEADGVQNMPKTKIKKRNSLKSTKFYGDTEACCPVCTKIFKHNISLQRHIRMSHANHTINPCTKCKLSFDSVQLLQKHMRSAHFDPEACECCHKLFYTRCSLNKHKRLCTKSTRDDELTELCSECGLGFRNVHILKQHIEKQHFKSIACDQCGEVFDSADKFKLHKRFHQNPDKFTCNECGKQFRKEISLREHMTTHTGGYLYSCDVCQKPFRYNGNYFTHRRKAHPDTEFPTECNFTCDYCDRSFHAKSGILLHMKSHIANGFPETGSGPLADYSETPEDNSFQELYAIEINHRSDSKNVAVYGLGA